MTATSVMDAHIYHAELTPLPISMKCGGAVAGCRPMKPTMRSSEQSLEKVVSDQQHSLPAPLRDTVYRRTVVGQKELVSPSVPLAPDDRRLLGVLTGFTSLDALLALLRPTTAPDQMIARLLELGLMEPVEEAIL
jgi:hypothetical protein